MCLLAIYFQQIADAPILMVAHRDEFYDRPAVEPQVQLSRPPVLCGLDARAGGTWLGVNGHGLVVAVTNRPRQKVTALPRSRGLLCRELLAQESATVAADLAEEELCKGIYAGANYLCVDARAGWFICGGDRVNRTALTAGLHMLANSNPDSLEDPRIKRVEALLPEPQENSAAIFLGQVITAMSPPADPQVGRAGIVLRTTDRGTVSSTALALTIDPANAIYRYADGPPDKTEYIDYSDKLRQVLTR